MRRPTILLRVLPLFALTACAKTPEPTSVAAFATGLGKMNADACKVENKGKRFILEGYVLPSQTVHVSDGVARMDLYDVIKDGEGQGECVSLNLDDGDQVSFDTKDHKSSFSGDEATITGIRLHTTTGDVAVTERVAVVFDLEVIQHFQTGEVTACQLEVVELQKR